jgi:hypothetical protein
MELGQRSDLSATVYVTKVTKIRRKISKSELRQKPGCAVTGLPFFVDFSQETARDIASVGAAAVRQQATGTTSGAPQSRQSSLNN